MRPTVTLVVALATAGLMPAAGRGEEPAPPGRPQMTMLETSGEDPLADVKKPAKRRSAARQPTCRRCEALVSATSAAGPLNMTLSRDAREAAVRRGVRFLLAAQGADGGWNSGEHRLDVPADLASTSIASLALLKAKPGALVELQSRSVSLAADFVVNKVAEWERDGQWRPTSVDDRVVADLGGDADAALAALFLAEHVARAEDGRRRYHDSVARLLAVLCQRLETDPAVFQERAHRLTRAVVAHAAATAERAGVTVPDGLVQRVVDGCPRAEDFCGRAARIGCLHAASRQAGGRPTDEGTALADTIVQPVLADYQGRWPFGTGGEVFLSLVFIGGMLSDTGTQTAVAWNEGVGVVLVQAQNSDGSWTGSSCINSRTFCTSSAVLVLATESVDARVAARR
jgi:hypothetical protein